jgi:hypothetical protein
MENTPVTNTLQAGTGAILTLSQVIRKLQEKGYPENLIPNYDHLACRSNEIELYPGDIVVDEMVRFENTSDPDDQSILYAISSPTKNIKGLYVDSYGLYHDELSIALIQKLRESGADCAAGSSSH